jgi:Putative auto-transporter adhesin, head GIN domain
MRRLAVLLLVAPLLATGCHYRIGNQVVGSGKRVLEKRDVSPFTSISTEGAFEIEVVCRQPVSLQIEGDENVLPLISTEVSNSVLRLKPIQGYSVANPITVKITVPNLDGLSASGAGKIAIFGLENDKFEIDSSGAPTIRVAGNTKVVDISTSGAARIDTHRLHASRAVVDSKGVSNVELEATDQLDVTISGPSHVTYEGDPVVTKKINGPGTLEKKNSGGA